MSSVHEILKQHKEKIEDRRQIIEDAHRSYPNHQYRLANFHRDRAKRQIFKIGFQFNDDQSLLDKVHMFTEDLTEKFGDDENFVGFMYNYSARSKWRNQVGPKTEILIPTVDGDLVYVVVSVIFTDPDY